MLTECKSVLLGMNYRQSGGHYGRLLLKMAVFPQRRKLFLPQLAGSDRPFLL